MAIDSFKKVKTSRSYFDRETYVKSLDLGSYSDYVSRINYFAQDELNTEIRTLMGVTCFERNQQLLGVKGIPSEIIVFPRAFDSSLVQTEDDFLITLDHELRHAWQAYTEPELFSRPKCLSIPFMVANKVFPYLGAFISFDDLFPPYLAEYDATLHELKLAEGGKRNVSPEHLTNIKKHLNYYSKKLSSQQRGAIEKLSTN